MDHQCDRQMDRQTDGQNYDTNSVSLMTNTKTEMAEGQPP